MLAKKSITETMKRKKWRKRKEEEKKKIIMNQILTIENEKFWIEKLNDKRCEGMRYVFERTDDE